MENSKVDLLNQNQNITVLSKHALTKNLEKRNQNSKNQRKPNIF
jgi:hypothetical protein